MLGLTLREEFRGKRLKGTQIELAGATQQSASSFLEITYPTTDLLKALEATGPDKGRPLVLMGERGQGKSHLMAVLHHALSDPESTEKWLKNWSQSLNQPQLEKFQLRNNMTVISESLHRQHYKFLWDILFERHPNGTYIRGKWEGRGEKKTDIPDYSLILEMLQNHPVALILDEFQTWFDGLTNTKQYPWKNWAFNFIQILSEIASDHPELLLLVVSVRNGTSDAYLQIHRVNPSLVDFKGPNAKRDRQRLLLHRLFDNRAQVASEQIEKRITVHVGEYLRLSQIPAPDHDKVRQDFLESWPYAPHVVRLLEDQVLVATEAQETRDLIRILVDLFKNRPERSPVITAADFSIENEQSGIAALLESVANSHHAALREKALRNLQAVRDAVSQPSEEVPNLTEIISALWLRSLAIDNQAGAEPETLQIDITRERKIDTNSFQVQLSHIVENSFNIHKTGSRLIFREDENAEAKLRSAARNDKLFADGADYRHLAREIRYVLGGAEDVAPKFKVIVLGKNWLSNPWTDLEESDRPANWDDRVPLLVLPESPDSINSVLGKWLRDHLLQNRNAVRFVIPRLGTTNVYWDWDLLLLARAVIKAQEWRQQDSDYARLHTKYQNELRNIIKERFDRFAILQSWNYADPSKSRFQIEPHGEKGAKIPQAIDERILKNLFIPEEFEKLVIDAAKDNAPLGKLIREMREPRPSGEECVPWIGEAVLKDKITRMCAAGVIAINLRGSETLQRLVGEDEQVAWTHMKGRIGTGRHLEETILLLPQAIPVTVGAPIIQSNPSEHTTEEPYLPPSTNPDPKPPTVGNTSLFTSRRIQTTPLHIPATSPLNLLGQVESWGIGPATYVKTVKIEVDALTGAQLQKLLRNLPDGITYELKLEKEDEC